MIAGSASAGYQPRPSCRILFVRAYIGTPFDAVSRSIVELAGFLAEQGDQVSLLALGHLPQHALPLIPESVEQVSIPTLGLSTERRNLRPLLQAWFMVAASAVALARRRSYDCVVTVDTPTGVGLIGRLFARLSMRATKHVCWVLDLIPQQVRDLQVRGPYRALRPIRAALNRAGYGGADLNVVLGPCMRARLSQLVPGTEATVLPIWQDGRWIAPADADSLRSKLKLEESIVVLYSGHAATRHAFDGLLEAASVLRSNEKLVFLFAGSGPRLDEISQRLQNEDLPNVRVIPPVPAEEVARLLSVGDVHVVTLDRRATGTCVPSKAYAGMAVGRPVIFLGDEASTVALDIKDADCGLVVPEADGSAIAAALEQLVTSESERRRLGNNGRKFFLSQRERAVVGQRWRSTLHGLITERQGADRHSASKGAVARRLESHRARA